MRKTLPKQGRSWEDIEQEMLRFRDDDVDWRRGRMPFQVWYGGDDLFDIQIKGYTMFMQENGGGAGRAFMSLKYMEDGIIDFAAGLFNGPDAVGHITSGGSESIFVAMKAARDWAREKYPQIKKPQVVIPFSGHPTFNRAAEYLGLSITRIPVGDDLRADVEAMARAIGPNTIALIGSAVCFPYGVIDPIGELSAVAKERGLWLHVDACVSGYTAPFCKELGYPIPDFDFSVPGVMSMSADLHKYGFCAKGTSTVLYRNPEFEKFQPFVFDQWPLGRFSNPNVASSRPGGSISSAWALMNYLGYDGYLKLNDRLMKMRQRYMDGINAIDGVRINGSPHSLIITYSAVSDEVDMSAVADELGKREWYVGRLRQPPGILIGLSLPHEAVVDEYLGHLADAVAQVKKTGAKGKVDAPATY